MTPGGNAMRFVSLNLDVEDATVLRRALAGTLSAGRALPARPVDDDYRALHALIGELDRLLEAPAASPRPVAPLAGCERAVLTMMPGGRLAEG